MRRHEVVAMLLVLGAGPARADVAPVAAELTATSTLGRGARHAAWRAFDLDTATTWCPAARDDAAGGGQLTVTFAQPVTVRALEVYGQPHDDAAVPRALTVTSDGGAVTVAFDASAVEPTAITLPAGVTSSLTFRFGPRPAGDDRPACITEIDLQLDGAALVYGAPPAAVAALPTALTTLAAALGRCDRKRLARLVHVPVGFREIDMTTRHTYPESSETDPRAFRRVRDVPCDWTVHDQDGDPSDPVLDQGMAPGVVRVVGGAAITTVFWELSWRARRWQLTSIDSAFFE
ncbi:MAG: hypothetical protein IPL61_35215 [Myxococcales bacterium]|nr:hypothetical protein [Myxococcales bacterium]